MEHPDQKSYWFFRRTTMFISMAIICVFTLIFIGLGIQWPETVTTLGPIIPWFYGAFSLPIIGYYSNTAIEEAGKRLINK